MKSRLDEVYQRTRDSGGLALNIFLTIGYPSLEESLDLARAALAGGATICFAFTLWLAILRPTLRRLEA